MEVLGRRPHLFAETVEGARTMAEALDGIWRSMEQVITAAVKGDTLTAVRRRDRPALP
jgi:hypothetical protein